MTATKEGNRLAAMPSTRHRAVIGAAVALVLLTGCSSGTDKTDVAEKGPSAQAPAPSSEPQAAPPGAPAIGVSPGGVTTRMDEPAQSTEEQYAQSCLAAKAWLTGKGGDMKDQVEPLLQEVQTSTESSPITFRKTWAELSTAQQAAVIIAVNAAVDGGC